MRNLYFLFLVLLILSSISACQNGGGGVNPVPKAGLIVGKWGLQQEKFMQYTSSVLTADTTYTTSSVAGHAQFNADGSYNSASHSISRDGSSSLAGGTIVVARQDSTYGTYTLNGSALNLSSSLAGFSNGIAFFGSSTQPAAFTVNTAVSQSVQINELTSSKLTIHLELIFTAANSSSVTQTYKNEEDLYYTR